MGRNLRLDWRALALLGALLSIIVKWPALVYAMPTIFLPSTTATAPTTLTIINETNPSAILLQNLTNQFDPNYNTMPDMLSNRNDNNESDKKTGNRDKTENQKSENENENEKVNSKQSDESMKKSEYITSGELQRIGDTGEQSTIENSHNERTLLTVTSKNAQLHNTQRLKMLNLKSNKRKRKKSNDESTDGVNLEVPPSTPSYSDISHSDNTNNNNNKMLSSSNKVNNKIDEIVEKRTLNTTTSSNIIVEISENENNQSSHVATATESTISPTLANTIESTISASSYWSYANSSSNIKTHYDLASFKFSSSHQIAILSRTERSIHATAMHHHSKDEIADDTISSPTNTRRISDVVMKPRRLNNSRNNHRSNSTNKHFNNLDRNERSTVSHLTGPMRKIQLYIKNRYIQILMDGTVNGTYDDQSDYTILQRSTVDVGRIKLQSVATCLYLCMDQCGSIYGSKDFTDDCVFNENMEQHNYNTYSSTYNSNSRRVYYLALNRHGEPRRLQIPPTRSLGKLATYTNAITETVAQERVEQLIAKTFGANRIKHGIRQLCDTGKPLIELIDSRHFKARPMCNSNIGNNNNSNNGSNINANSSNHSSRNNNSSSNSNSNNGQLLNNVPVANDKNSLDDSSSHSLSVNSTLNSVSNSSSTEPTNSDSLTNSNISSNINSNSNSSSNSHSNSMSSIQQQHNGPKKKKKRRKCRPYENEEEHNCHRGPQALRKKGNGNLKKCREQLQQQQQASSGTADATLLNATRLCPPKRGGKKHGGPNSKKQQNVNSRNGGGNNQRGKKLNGNRSTQNTGKKTTNNASKKGKKNGLKRQKKHPPTTSTASTTLSTTLRTFFYTTTQSSVYMTTTPISVPDHIDSLDPKRMEITSDRGEREQRNVHQSSEETSNHDADEHDEQGDAEEDPDHDGGDADTDVDDSYEDMENHRNKHTPEQPVDNFDSPLTHLTGGADDFYYYDQTDL